MYYLLLLASAVSAADAAPWERRLGDLSWRVRVRASADLVRSGRLSLCRRLRGCTDPEVARRARLAYEDIRDAILRTMEPFPCIDAAWVIKYGDDDWVMQSRLQHYLDCHRTFAMKPLPWMGYRRATRDWASDRIDAGVPVWLIRLHHWHLHRLDERNGFGLNRR